MSVNRQRTYITISSMQPVVNGFDTGSKVLFCNALLTGINTRFLFCVFSAKGFVITTVFLQQGSFSGAGCMLVFPVVLQLNTEVLLLKIFFTSCLGFYT